MDWTFQAECQSSEFKSQTNRDQAESSRVVSRPESSKKFMVKANDNLTNEEEPQTLRRCADDVNYTGNRTFAI